MFTSREWYIRSWKMRRAGWVSSINRFSFFNEYSSDIWTAPAWLIDTGIFGLNKILQVPFQILGLTLEQLLQSLYDRYLLVVMKHNHAETHSTLQKSKFKYNVIYYFILLFLSVIGSSPFSKWKILMSPPPNELYQTLSISDKPSTSSILDKPTTSPSAIPIDQKATVLNNKNKKNQARSSL